MFVVRVTYLTGRVYSAVFDDGDEKIEPEWPPHPSRLFSALVAAWGDTGEEQDLKPALEWIERQTAPTIYAGTVTARKLVRAFVPVNDRLNKQMCDTVNLPEERWRKARAFPSATLSHPEVYFVWNEAPPDRVRKALDQIFLRTSSLGHSATLVSLEIADAIPTEHLNIWHPHLNSGTRIRIPHAGRLSDLIERYKRYQADPNKINRPGIGKTTLYGPASKVQAPAPQGMFDRMIVLRRGAGPRASLPSTLSVLAALRGAILTLAPQPPPEYLSGHAPQSTPANPARSEEPHLALIPLPFIDAPHATGDLLGVAALLPKTLTAKERNVCWEVLSKIQKLKMPWGEWEVSIADAQEHRRGLRPETWTDPHDIWSTVTPFVFDRFPRDPYGPEAEQVVRDAFVRVGLPEPREIDLHYNPWHLGVPKAPAFPPVNAKPGKPQRYHCHARVRFDHPIVGPVVAGAGRFYGYGLFHRLVQRRDAQ